MRGTESEAAIWHGCPVTEVRKDPVKRGRIFEAAVGADLLRLPEGQLFYWRDGTDEVDFVLSVPGRVYAVEVKSGRDKNQDGLTAFQIRYKTARACTVHWENYAQFAADPLRFLENLSAPI